MNESNGAIRDRVNGSGTTNGFLPRVRNLNEGLTVDRPVEPPQARPAFGKLIWIWLKRLRVPASFATAGLGILAFGGLFSDQKDAVLPAARALDVNVVIAVTESGYDVHRSYLGTIESRRESSLSFEVGGKIDSVVADEGQVVQKDEVLAELDTELLRSDRDVIMSRVESAQARLDEMIAGPRLEDIESARALVRRWESQLELAGITSKRLFGLVRANAVSQQESDDAVFNEQVVKAQLDLAASQLAELNNGTRKEQLAAQRATVSQLKAELRTVEIKIEKSQLLAPYDGIISARYLDEGEVIASGQAVFELLDNHQLEARVGLPVGSIDSVTRNERHQLVYRLQKIEAKLKSVRPEKNSDTRTVDVVFEIEPSANLASIGDIIRLELPVTISETGFWIPTSAMVETYRGLWGCYVAEKTDSDSSNALTRLRELEVLHHEGEMAFVRGGLKRGERIIISGVHRLVPDQAVNIARRIADVASR